MADREDRGGIAGISFGGIIVIVGIVVMVVWSFLLGLIITLVGLIAFGGFARGKWYSTSSKPPGCRSRRCRRRMSRLCGWRTRP